MAHIDPDAYSVYSYQTGEQLEGAPTKALVLASLDAGDSGAVCATYDRDEALWSYVRSDERDAYEARGERVRTVYVLED